MAMKAISGDSYRLMHNTLIEGVRVMVFVAAMLLLSIATIPIRLLRGRKP